MLYELAQKQRELMKNIYEKHNLEGQDLYEKKKLAILVELGELANELQFFKYWKKNNEPKFSVPCEECNGRGFLIFGDDVEIDCTECGRTGKDESKNPALEEYVDGIHFLLEIAIEKSYKDDALRDMLEEIKPLYYTDLTAQFNTLYFHISQSLQGQIELILRLYLGIAKIVGFSEADIRNAYFKKNMVNFARQRNGY